MSLTGWPLTWLTVAITVAAFVGLVWFWPRLGGRRAGPVVLRAVALLGVNLLVLITAGIQLNDEYLFFAGWSDLAGAVSGHTATSSLHGGGSAQAAAQATVSGEPTAAAGRPLEALPAGSRIQAGVTSYTVTGAASHLTAQILVTLPPGYTPTPAGQVPTRSYPVLETFSGYPGSLTQWVKTMRMQSYLATEVSAHHIAPTILISPQVEIPAGTDTECVDGRPGDPAVETWLAEDVPAWVEAHLPVKTDRGSWATIGLSSGGWCAAMAAMLHPARFGGAVVLGGYFRPLFEPSYEPFPAATAQSRRYDLVALAKSAPPPLALWVQTSHADPVSYSTSTALLKAAHSPLSVTATVLQDAGHRIDIWRELVPNALRWLGSSLPGFTP